MPKSGKSTKGSAWTDRKGLDDARRAEGSVERSSLPRPTGVIVGRERELSSLERGLTDVPVAVICGVPGVGKSTLALVHAATWKGAATYMKLSTETSVSQMSETIQRRLGARSHGLALDDAERLDEIWSLLDRVGALLVLDDLHLLPAAARSSIVDSATRALRCGRLVAASRELLPISPGLPDRLQLKLEGLDRSASAHLWERLKELYGPAGDFELAWRQSLGNPYLLRQAHVATLSEEHPLRAVVRALGADDARIAGVVALSQVPLPKDTLCGLFAGASASLDRLVTRMVVDVTADSEYAMHDLMREAIAQELDAKNRDELRRFLIEALPNARLDPVTIVQETARHLRALGRHQEIATLLVAKSASLIRQGANLALLNELEAVPESVMSAEIQLLRAQALARSMQTRRACSELRGLVAAGRTQISTRFFFASCATMAGELDDAERVLQGLLREDLPKELRSKAAYRLAWVYVYAGRIDEATAILDRLEDASDAQARLGCWSLRMFALVLEGRSELSAELARRAVEVLEAEPRSRWSHLFTPSICTVFLAAAGRLDEAERALALVERGLRRPDEHIEVGWIRMVLRYERGERCVALDYYRTQQRLLDRSGYLAGMVWTRAYLGRLLLLLGRRNEALGLLAETAEQCRASGAIGLQRFVETSHDEDPLSPDWLRREPKVPAAKLGDRVRAQVRVALRRACSGSGLPSASSMPLQMSSDRGYAFDRALVELAQAISAWRQGRARTAGGHLRSAVHHAAECEADPDLIPKLYEQWRTADFAGSAATGAELVLDGMRHEVREGDVCVNLSSRLTLRRLLEALLLAPGYHLDKNAIARALWGCEYDPLRHESSLKSNIRRLRELLEATSLSVVSADEGYRLSLPPGCVVVAPRAPDRTDVDV